MSNFIQVSPRFTLETNTFEVTSSEGKGPYSFGDKTAARLIYQDRIQGWFFEPVYELLDKNKYQDKYTVLAVSIVTPLIESLENYIKGKTPTTGKNSSSSFFKDGAKRIFPVLAPVPADNWAIDVLYEGVRCGFAHEGFLKERKTRKCNIIIASQGEDKNPIKYDKSKYPFLNILLIYSFLPKILVLKGLNSCFIIGNLSYSSCDFTFLLLNFHSRVEGCSRNFTIFTL
jgi:hypothetical protein